MPLKICIYCFQSLCCYNFLTLGQTFSHLSNHSDRLIKHQIQF